MNAVSEHEVKGDEAETQINVPLNFKHVTDGNFADTQRAIEAYLVSQGVQKNSYVAELIMFMERSFAGKNLKGQRSHYQHIMPCKNWMKGDTLSEKLIRCKDKETFKSRFDRIGTTAKLTRDNFEHREIVNLDFKGHLYLRLIDTNRNNLSRFYRNDSAAEAFIEQALSFYRAQLKAERRARKPEVLGTGKAEAVNPSKPAMAYLQNPKPLLTEAVNKHSTKTAENSLKLVHSFSTGEQPIPKPKPIPEGIKDIKTSDFGFDAEVMPLPLVSSTELTGVDVYLTWRKSVLAIHPEEHITQHPTKALIGQFANFHELLTEAIPGASTANFFDHLTKEWFRASHYLKNAGGYGFGYYPEMPALLRHSNHVLTWYEREKRSRTESKISPLLTTLPKPETTLQIETVPMSASASVVVPGRTFTPGRPQTLEYWIAYFLKNPGPWSADSVVAYRIALKKFSADLTASEDRIEELCRMTPEELEMTNGR